MPLSVSTLYDSVCDELCEPSGCQLGLVTQTDIIRAINLTAKEFIYTSGLFRGLFCIPTVYGQSLYTQPEYSTGAQQAWFDNTTMFESNTYTWDQTDSSWRLEQFGKPNEWREDNVGVMTLDIKPKPNVSGIPFTDEGAGFYGVIQDIDYPDQYTFVIDPSNGPLYGTISTCDTSSVFVDGTGGLFGTIGEACGSIGNVMATTYSNQYAVLDSLDAYLDNVPDSFEFILLAGILMRVFAMDGELKSPELSSYWTRAYRDGLNYLRSISGMLQIGGSEGAN